MEIWNYRGCNLYTITEVPIPYPRHLCFPAVICRPVLSFAYCTWSESLLRPGKCRAMSSYINCPIPWVEPIAYSPGERTGRFSKIAFHYSQHKGEIRCGLKLIVMQRVWQQATGSLLGRRYLDHKLAVWMNLELISAHSLAQNPERLTAACWLLFTVDNTGADTLLCFKQSSSSGSYDRLAVSAVLMYAF